jgi:hypothetical protein
VNDLTPEPQLTFTDTDGWRFQAFATDTRAGQRGKGPAEPAENAVSAAPATSDGTTGSSSAAPSAISPADTALTNVSGATFFAGG